MICRGLGTKLHTILKPDGLRVCKIDTVGDSKETGPLKFAISSLLRLKERMVRYFHVGLSGG